MAGFVDIPAALVREGRVNVVGPDGAQSVPVESVPMALDQGLRLETEDERRQRKTQEAAKDRPLAAAAFGAADTATFGLASMVGAAPASTAEQVIGPEGRVVTKLTPSKQPTETAEFLRALKAENPLAYTAGGIATMFLPGAFSGAAGLVAEAGAAAGKVAGRAASGAVGKALELGAAGAVEGALVGGQNLISEASLGETELTAESILAHVGLGSLFGAGAGAGLAALGSAAKAGGKLLTFPKALTGGSLKELAEESAVKATGARGAQISRLGSKEKIRQVGRDMLDYRLSDGRPLLSLGRFGLGDTTESLFGKLKIAKHEVADRLKAIREQVDTYARANPELMPAPAEYLRRVHDEVIKPLRESSVPSVRALAQNVETELGGVAERIAGGETLGLSDLTRIRRDLGKVVYPKAPRGGGLPPPAPAHAQELQKAERILEDFIESSTERVVAKMDPALAGSYAKARRQTESFIKAEQMAGKASLQDLGIRAVSLTDYLAGVGGAVGSIATGGAGPLLGAGLASAVNHVLRERGRSTVAVLADRASRLQPLKEAATAAQKRIADGVQGVIDRAGKGRARTAVPGAAARALLDTLFSPAEREKTQDRREAAKRRAEELAFLVAAPETIADRIDGALGGLDDVAPGIVNQMAHTASRAVEFLHSKAPKRPEPMGLTPMARRWTPTDDEIDRFERYVAAAADPLSVVESLNNGTLTPEAVETLKELYPKMHEAVTRELAGRAGELEQELSWDDQVQLSILFGVPLAETLQPDFLAIMQAPMPEVETSEGQGPGGMRTAGLDQLDLSDTRLTESERLMEAGV